MKMCPTSLVTSKMQIKAPVRHHCTLTAIPVVRKIVPVVDEDMEKLEPRVLLTRPLSGAAALENNLLMSLKIKHGVSI